MHDFVCLFTEGGGFVKNSGLWQNGRCFFQNGARFEKNSGRFEKNARRFERIFMHDGFSLFSWPPTAWVSPQVLPQV